LPPPNIDPFNIGRQLCPDQVEPVSDFHGGQIHVNAVLKFEREEVEVNLSRRLIELSTSSRWMVIISFTSSGDDDL
jgi:hypothetical protein